MDTGDILFFESRTECLEAMATRLQERLEAIKAEDRHEARQDARVQLQGSVEFHLQQLALLEKTCVTS